LIQYIFGFCDFGFPAAVEVVAGGTETNRTIDLIDVVRGAHVQLNLFSLIVDCAHWDASSGD
jgi:hypothetical protein